MLPPRAFLRPVLPLSSLFSLQSAAGPLLRAPADALLRPTDTCGLLSKKKKARGLKIDPARESRAPRTAAGLVPAAQVLESARTRVGEVTGAGGAK